MKGIELAKDWFQTKGLPLLQQEASDALPFLACGLAGHGSECFGFDDELSPDHDFSACFSIWLPEEKEAEFGFRLTRLYEKLLKESPPPVHSQESLCSSSERGVLTIEDFFSRHIGLPGAPQHWRQWLYTPEYALAEAVNGEVFLDGPGIFSQIRKTIRTGMPEDVRLKKLAARSAMMAQTGQYNFQRCLKHGERGAAALALHEFTRNAISLIFLLNRNFAPYYKWAFRAMRPLPRLGDMASALEFLLTERVDTAIQSEIIEDICLKVEEELRTQGLSSSSEAYLEAHAVEIMQRIRNQEIRSLHIMEG